MYKKILVPLDGSELAEQAIETAASIARRNDGELILVRAVELTVLPPAAWSYIDVDEVHKEERAAYQQYLDDKKIEGLPCRTLLVEGQGVGADGLLSAAEAEDVDLIVMTSHGRTGLNRWLFGSVAERVVRHAPCPVLTIGPKTLAKQGAKSELPEAD